METSTYKGKVGRLPIEIRNELNRRLQDGEPAGKLLRWLNALPQTRAIIQEQFGGDAITPQNLSEWRKVGYRDWLQKQDKVEQIKTLSEYSFRLAEAGGASMSDGSAAIAAGKMQEWFETADQADIAKMIPALVNLRSVEIAARRVNIEASKLKQKDRELALEEQRFQRQTAELFLKWYDKESARKIAENGESRTVQMDKLVTLMFGAPKPTGEAPNAATQG